MVFIRGFLLAPLSLFLSLPTSATDLRQCQFEYQNFTRAEAEFIDRFNEHNAAATQRDGEVRNFNLTLIELETEKFKAQIALAENRKLSKKLLALAARRQQACGTSCQDEARTRSAVNAALAQAQKSVRDRKL